MCGCSYVYVSIYICVSERPKIAKRKIVERLRVSNIILESWIRFSQLHGIASENCAIVYFEWSYTHIVIGDIRAGIRLLLPRQKRNANVIDSLRLSRHLARLFIGIIRILSNYRVTSSWYNVAVQCAQRKRLRPGNEEFVNLV